MRNPLFVCALLFLAACAGAQPQPDAPPERSVIVHLFEWTWPDVAQECEAFLGPKGFKAVQVSPVVENALVEGRPWWERYQPASYRVETRSGGRAAFADMVARCRAAGVEIYVDALLNHMTGVYAGVGVAGSSFGEYDYPGLYTYDDFHHCGLTENDDIWDFNDPEQVRNCELVNLADLKTESPAVRERLAAYLQGLVDLGVAGFRLDAARHLPTEDIRAILDLVVGQPFIYQEVTDASWAEPYYPNGIVTEFQFSHVVSRVFHDGPLARLHGEGSIWQEVPFLPTNEALVFIDNHDNQRGHGTGGGVVTYKDGALHDLAMAFLLAYPYGEARVMSSYAFEDDRQGPPMDADERIRRVHTEAGLNCGRGEWVCEHRHPAVAGMVGFRRHTASETYVGNWWTNGGNRIAFSRGEKGFIVINREDRPLSETLQTGLAPGRYCDVISGELADGACAGGEVTVAADGTARFEAAPMTAVAVHVGARLESD